MRNRFICLTLGMLMLLTVFLTGCNQKKDAADVEQISGITLTMWVITDKEVANTDEEMAELKAKLLAKYGEGDISEVVSGLSGTSYKISYESLNQNLYNGLGLPSDTPVEINFYISAKVGEDKKYYSAPVKAKVQVTAA